MRLECQGHKSSKQENDSDVDLKIGKSSEICESPFTRLRTTRSCLQGTRSTSEKLFRHSDAMLLQTEEGQGCESQESSRDLNVDVRTVISMQC